MSFIALPQFQRVQPLLRGNFFSMLSFLIPQPLQVSSSSAPHIPTSSSCFSTLLQTAYESRTLGEKKVQTELLAAVPHLALQQVLRSAKQVLLYLRSTVENFSQVSAFLPPNPSPAQCVLFSDSAPILWNLGSQLCCPRAGPLSSSSYAEAALLTGPV